MDQNKYISQLWSDLSEFKDNGRCYMNSESEFVFEIGKTLLPFEQTSQEAVLTKLFNYQRLEVSMSAPYPNGVLLSLNGSKCFFNFGKMGEGWDRDYHETIIKVIKKFIALKEKNS